MKYDELDASRIATAVVKKELSAVDVVRSSLERIRFMEPQINALITLMEDQALERAALVDRKVA